MPASRRRRIAQWTAIAVVAPVLLFASYVSTWLVLSKAANSRMIPFNVVTTTRPAFAPLISYSDSSMPGAISLNQLWWEIVAESAESDPVVWTVNVNAFPLMPSSQGRRSTPFSLRESLNVL